jgi:hypothetical protein
MCAIVAKGNFVSYIEKYKKIEFGVCMSLKGWKKQKYLQKSLIALLENVS